MENMWRSAENPPWSHCNHCVTEHRIQIASSPKGDGNRKRKGCKPMNEKDRIRRLKLGGGIKTEEVARVADVGLVAGSGEVARWMAKEFNKNFDAYDRAIDAVYNNIGIGGSRYHHLLDGQHHLLGALRAVRDVSADDGFAREFMEAGEHLLRDAASVSGINPFFSLTAEQFNAIAKALRPLGVSKPFLADAWTFNAPELLGGVMGMGAILAISKKGDPGTVSSLAGTYAVSSLATANPLLLPVAAGGLVYAFKHEEDKKAVLLNAGKGSLATGGAVLTAGVVGGPAWIGCVTAMVAAVSIKNFMDSPQKSIDRARKVTKPAAVIVRRAAERLGEGAFA